MILAHTYFAHGHGFAGGFLLLFLILLLGALTIAVWPDKTESK
jgi:hypothetical protein